MPSFEQSTGTILKQQQSTVLSQKQLRSLELLHLPLQALESRLAQELTANPVLEEGDISPTAADDSGAEDASPPDEPEDEALYAEKAAEDEDEDGTGISWKENWPEDEHAAPPLAIRMHLKWSDGTSEYWLRRVAGVAKDSTFGTRKTHDGNTQRFSNALEGGATGGGEAL